MRKRNREYGERDRVKELSVPMPSEVKLSWGESRFLRSSIQRNVMWKSLLIYARLFVYNVGTHEMGADTRAL